MSCVRIRPTATVAQSVLDKNEVCACRQDEGSVSLVKNQTGQQQGKFTYDHVFGDESQNSDVFAKLVEPLISKAVQGYNVCIFTYGQTSSGKTHTMKGSEIDPGMIPLTLEKLFAAGQGDGQQVLSAAIDYVEIYNETINDLLKRGNANLELKLDSNKGLKIAGLTQTEVTSVSEAIELL